MLDIAQLVKLGWDDYARTTRSERTITAEYKIIKLFSEMLPHNCNIIDIGCGSGKPITKYFEDEGHNITGVDISPKQVQKAKENLKNSKIIAADMLKYEFPNNYFDAAFCLHSLVHIERIHHKKVLDKIYGSLKPGGLLLISIKTKSFEGVTFLTPGIQMFYSHFDQFESTKHLTAAKLFIIHKSSVKIDNENYVYAIAKKEGVLTARCEPYIVYTSKN